MHQIVCKFVDYLITNNISSVDMREIHIYSFEVMIGKILNYGTLLLLSWIINCNILSTLVFMIVFFSLRTRSGGFHAKTFWGCYFGTVAIYFGVSNIIVPVLIMHKYLHLCVIVVSIITVFLFAPVNHPNLHLNVSEIQICRKSARGWIIGISICMIVLIKLNVIPEYVHYIVAAMGINTGLLLIAKILKQEVR